MTKELAKALAIRAETLMEAARKLADMIMEERTYRKDHPEIQKYVAQFELALKDSFDLKHIDQAYRERILGEKMG